MVPTTSSIKTFYNSVFIADKESQVDVDEMDEVLDIEDSSSLLDWDSESLISSLR